MSTHLSPRQVDESYAVRIPAWLETPRGFPIHETLSCNGNASHNGGCRGRWRGDTFAGVPIPSSQSSTTLDQIISYLDSAAGKSPEPGHLDAVRRMTDGIPKCHSHQGHSAIVRSFLRADADVNEPAKPKKAGGKMMRRGTSALMLAVENGHFELDIELVATGADQNDQRYGFTPSPSCAKALPWH